MQVVINKKKQYADLIPRSSKEYKLDANLVGGIRRKQKEREPE